jgi:uncharacterized protein YggT (Ycf19 family)
MHMLRSYCNPYRIARRLNNAKIAEKIPKILMTVTMKSLLPFRRIILPPSSALKNKKKAK